MKRFRIINISILLFLYAAVGAGAQGRTDSLINEKGRFDQWRVYQLKESGIIGGNVKTIYKLSEGDTLYGQDPYSGK